MKTRTEFSVFLVDDDLFFLSICEKMLQNIGIKKISGFSSSEKFFNNFQLGPDIILLDYNIDSLNGIDMLKKIKRYNPNALVVFISGQEDITVAVNALKYGAFDYLIKNQITEKKLEVLMDKAILLKELIRKRYRNNILQKALSVIWVPVLVYLVLETFFK
jgi:FixJ family two-component response regulator